MRAHIQVTQRLKKLTTAKIIKKILYFNLKIFQLSRNSPLTFKEAAINDVISLLFSHLKREVNYIPRNQRHVPLGYFVYSRVIALVDLIWWNHLVAISVLSIGEDKFH